MKHSIENQTTFNTSEGFIGTVSGGLDPNFIIKDNDTLNANWVGDFPPQGITAVPNINPIWTDRLIGGNGVAVDTTDWSSVIKNGGLSEHKKHRTNVYHSKDGSYHMDVEVTGYDRDQVEVESVGQKITVKLFKDHGSDFIGDFDENVYDTHEIEAEDWTHEFVLGSEYIVDQLEAKKWENGLLKIRVPKRESKKHDF